MTSDVPLSPGCGKCGQVTGLPTCFPNPCIFHAERNVQGTISNHIATIDRIRRGSREPARISLASYNTLDQLTHWLTDEEAKRGDVRNKAWALHAAKQVSELTAACRELIEQYRAQDNFTMGGALTNAPFLKIAAVLADED